MILNSFAQRSFQDLTQYPVMPWILQDYESNVLNPQKPDTFRDLAKPIGTLGDPNRLQQFQERYEETPIDTEKCLYRTHYSSPGYVVGFHVRKHPQWMIKFQSGKYDDPNRLFNSIHEEWSSCLKSPSCVKELIPEFFMADQKEMFVNALELDFGTSASGQDVKDVGLPNWASSPEDFLKQHSSALESPFVSNDLNKWIDLIFGCSQNSKEANNVFHPYSYEGSVDWSQIKDTEQKLMVETWINEFGQTPRQLFKEPHPKKGTV